MVLHAVEKTRWSLAAIGGQRGARIFGEAEISSAREKASVWDEGGINWCSHVRGSGAVASRSSCLERRVCTTSWDYAPTCSASYCDRGFQQFGSHRPWEMLICYL